MTTHTSPAAGLSQCDLILALLQRHPGEWVSMLDLGAASGSKVVHSRISDLRSRGHAIEHKNQYKGRKVRSFYLLPALTPTTQGSLF